MTEAQQSNGATSPEGVQPLLELLDVSVVFDTTEGEFTALKSVSLSVQPGELVGVTGKSGSGKSMLLNVAGLLIPPTTGQVLIGGQRVLTLSHAHMARARRNDVGFVFQQSNLVPTLTVAENLSLPLELGGTCSRDARLLVESTLGEIGLEALADRLPGELSGGQMRCVAIVRALVGTRSVILADEPTMGLDRETSDEIMTVLRAKVDSGIAGMFVTHEPRFLDYADRVIRVEDGVLEEGM